MPYLVFGYKQGEGTSNIPPGAVLAELDPVSKDAQVTLHTPLIASSPKFVDGRVRSTIGKSSGKWYWEITVPTVDYSWVGISAANFGSSNILMQTRSPGDVVGIAMDLDLGNVEFFANGVSVGSQSVGAGTRYAFNRARVQATTDRAYVNITFNFGQSPFVYGPPSGFAHGLYDVP